MARYLDPKNDLLFKKIFGEHPHLLISFLNAILKFEDGSKIVNITYIPTELIPPSTFAKRSIVDVRCTDDKSRNFIVEMQMEWEKLFMQRILCNSAKVYSNQIKAGENYNNLEPVYGIAILNEQYETKSTKYYHHFLMTNKNNTEEVIEGMNIILLELPKFSPKTSVEKGISVLWLRFLKEINENIQEIPNEFTENKDIAEALEICNEAGLTPVERVAYDRYWDAISREKTLIEGKYERGKAEGIEIGEKRGMEKFILTAYKKGISTKQLASMFDLDKTFIEELVKNN